MDVQLAQYLATAFYIARFPLAGAAFVFCILLLRRTRNVGWLLLGLIFLQPFSTLVLRIVYATISSPVIYRVPTMNLNLDVPFYYILAATGLYLIFRGTKPEKRD